MSHRSLLFALLVCSATLPVRAGDVSGSVRLASGVARSPAVVYIEGSGPPMSTDAAAIVDQQNLHFVPRIQAIALGGSIVFRNSDRESHNVNSQTGCCSFNFLIPPDGESPPLSPDAPGLVRLLCNIHQQMRGYVMVCPNSLFAVTDTEGRFRISGVPDGVHRFVVWQEYSKRVSQEIQVAGETHVEFMLESSGALPIATSPLATRPVVAWTEVLRRITAKLEAAVQAAQKPGGGPEAERLAVDAYFEQFEASEFETAVRRFRGDGRVFVLERMFDRIRNPLLSDLATGRTDGATVRAAVAELENALEADIRELHKHRIFDRTALSSPQDVNQSDVPHVNATEIRGVITDLRSAFDRVGRLAADGKSAEAASLLADAYFQVFHRIEPALAARNFAEMRRIESRFLELRGRIQAGTSSEEVSLSLDSLWAEINVAAMALERDGKSGGAAALSGFWNAFVILTREGVEALLIVTALLMYLNRIGRQREKRVIYAGLGVALVATVLTWAGLQWIISQSGIARETIEGVAAIVAATLLFYVSYWLISKSEARRWQEFLTAQIGRGLSAGGKWAIGLAAFLAVYREGAETILMFQPLLVNPAAHELAGVVAGMLTAVVALAAIFWGLRFASVRMAIRPFFRVTGALLFVLAVIFAGKGVTELQEARLIAISPLPRALSAVVMALPHSLRDLLGIAPTVQSFAIQGTLLAGAIASLVALRLIGRVGAAVVSVRPVTHAKQPEPVVSESAV